MSRRHYEINFYIKKENFNVLKFLEILNKINILDYDIFYKDYSLKYNKNIEFLKKEFKSKKVKSFIARINLKKKTELNVSVYEEKNMYNVHMYITAINLEMNVFKAKDTKEFSKWLIDLFESLSSKLDCIYAYSDFEECMNNKKVILQKDDTYKIVEENKPYTFTPAIFNEISYFSKEILDMNNNRELVLSKDLAGIFEFNNGLLVIDEKNKLKDNLIKELKKRGKKEVKK